MKINKNNWQDILLIVSIFILAGAILWTVRKKTYLFDPDVVPADLDKAVSLARQNMLAFQKPEGDFIYSYSISSNKVTPGNNFVRQAGALWALANAHRYIPGEDTLAAVLKGLAYFHRHSDTSDGRSWLTLEKSMEKTGTLALVCLSHIELLTGEMAREERDLVTKWLKRYLNTLLSLRQADGHFAKNYSIENGGGGPQSSPYYDGEALLALVKAAVHSGAQDWFRADLKELALASAEVMHAKYVTRWAAEGNDQPVNMGFFHWGVMAFSEIQGAGWSDKVGGYAVEMSRGVAGAYRLAKRKHNAGYAYEGLAAALLTAARLDDQPGVKILSREIKKGLGSMLRLQVHGPLDQEASRAAPSFITGGFKSCSVCDELRIDFTQHSLHALLLGRQALEETGK